MVVNKIICDKCKNDFEYKKNTNYSGVKIKMQLSSHVKTCDYVFSEIDLCESCAVEFFETLKITGLNASVFEDIPF